MIEGLEGYSYLDRLGILGLTTKFLRADLIEVYKIFKGLDSLDPGRYLCPLVTPIFRTSFKLFKRRVNVRHTY